MTAMSGTDLSAFRYACLFAWRRLRALHRQPVKNGGGMQVQPSGDLVENRDAEVGVPEFNPRNVAGVKLGTIGKFLLGPAALNAKPSDLGSQRLKVKLFRHTGEGAPLLRIG